MITTFQHYDIVTQLGNKTMRRIYLATSQDDQEQQVVIKIFHADCLNQDYEYDTFIDRREFIKQIQHEHIVPIIDMGIDQGQLYVVTPYISEISLRSRLERDPSERWEFTEALELCMQLGQALNHMHACGITHNNIKPENILFHPDGKAMLTDFSMAGLIDENKLGYTSDSMTIRYMAPEQDLGQSGEKSDQYVLASLIYEVLTRQSPFNAQDFSLIQLQRVTQTPISPSRLVPNLPTDLDQVLLRALSSDPADRFSNITAFLDTLQAISHTFQMIQSVPAGAGLQQFLQMHDTYDLEQTGDVAEADTHKDYDDDDDSSPPLFGTVVSDPELPAFQEKPDFPWTFNDPPTSKPPAFPFKTSAGSDRKFSTILSKESLEDTGSIPSIATTDEDSVVQITPARKIAAFDKNSWKYSSNPPVDDLDDDDRLQTDKTAAVKNRFAREEMKQSKDITSPMAIPLLPQQQRAGAQTPVPPTPLSTPSPVNRYTPGSSTRARFMPPFVRHTRMLLLGVLVFALIAFLLDPYTISVFIGQQNQDKTNTGGNQIPKATATPIVINTPAPTIRPTPTPKPKPTATPKPKPTATPKPKPTPTPPPTSAPPVFVPTNPPEQPPAPQPTPTPPPPPPTPTPPPPPPPTPTPVVHTCYTVELALGSTYLRPSFQTCNWTADYVVIHYKFPDTGLINVDVPYNSANGKWEMDVNYVPPSGTEFLFYFTYSYRQQQYTTSWYSWTRP